MRTNSFASSRRTSAQWEQIVEQSETTALSLRAFCAELGVSLPSLCYWRSKLKGQAKRKPTGFTELKPTHMLTAAQPADGAMELRLTNGRIVRITGGRIDAQALRTLIEVAEAGGTC